MRNNKQKLFSTILEVIMLFLFTGALILEITYIFKEHVSVFIAIESVIPMILFYLLFSFMQMYPETWNLFIPVCLENRIYAIYLAKILKFIFTCMILYTTICDFLKQTSQNFVFWICLILGIAVVIYCKYKMWSILKRNHPRK